ncbi:hypothetical protein QJS66_12480 [Kocuria rhizophila]|nr:hypothetical protein QJS66_12480 [Kocuria rhizophila]
MVDSMLNSALLSLIFFLLTVGVLARPLFSGRAGPPRSTCWWPRCRWSSGRSASSFSWRNMQSRPQPARRTGSELPARCGWTSATAPCGSGCWPRCSRVAAGWRCRS